MRRRSLRTRLVALVLVLLAVAGAVIGLATTLSLREFLVDRLDEDLSTAGRIARRLPPPEAQGPPPDGALGPGLPFGILRAVVDGPAVAGETIDRDGQPQEIPASAVEGIRAAQPGAPPRSVDLGELGSYRILATTRTEDGNTVTVVTGLPEQRVQDTLTTTITIEVLAVVLTLIGAGVAGAVVVRRELRPLEQVAATATRVAALPLATGEVDLTERVPVTDPGSEVGQVGTALNRMLEHVGSALSERHAGEVQLRQFVADASHELRTPLAAIRGYAELARRERAAGGGGDAEYSLVRISSQAERMTTLVEDLLLLARLDAGRPLERAEVDLTRLVLDAVSDAHAAGGDHPLRLALPDEPVTVVGDASRLAQVLANLLANARTHTPPGTPVTVGIAVVGDAARLSVLDEGPGVAPDLLPRVFERFARGSASRSRQDGSTGLGLAIVDAVVAAHHGSVEVTSRPGRTEFTVELPR